MLAALPADATLLAGADGGAALPVEVADALAAFRRVRAGCFDEGCVALAEGDFGDLDALRAKVGGVPRRRGVDLGPFVLRRLAPTKAVAGDRAAVARVALERELGEPGFDVAALDGLVPEGDAWAAAIGRDALEALADRAGVELPAADGVEAVGVAVTGEVAVARARCVDEAAALGWAALAEARGLSTVRVGRVVEVEVAR